MSQPADSDITASSAIPKTSFVKVSQQWQCHKNCSSNWCWVYQQVNYKLMQEDVREWG